eukprot:2002605-Prymnesium_polylepis.2
MQERQVRGGRGQPARARANSSCESVRVGAQILAGGRLHNTVPACAGRGPRLLTCPVRLGVPARGRRCVCSVGCEDVPFRTPPAERRRWLLHWLWRGV